MKDANGVMEFTIPELWRWHNRLDAFQRKGAQWYGAQDLALDLLGFVIDLKRQTMSIPACPNCGRSEQTNGKCLLCRVPLIIPKPTSIPFYERCGAKSPDDAYGCALPVAHRGDHWCLCGRASILWTPDQGAAK